MARSSAAWDASVGRHLVGLVALAAGALALVGATLGLAVADQADEAATAVWRWRQVDERTTAVRAAGSQLVAEVAGPADPAIRADRVRRRGEEIVAELDRIAEEVGGEAPGSLAAVADAADELVGAGVAVIEATDDLVRLDATVELDARAQVLGDALAAAEADLRDRERSEAAQRYRAATATGGRGVIGVVVVLALVVLAVTASRRLTRRRLEARYGVAG